MLGCVLSSVVLSPAKNTNAPVGWGEERKKIKERKRKQAGAVNGKLWGIFTVFYKCASGKVSG